MGVVYSTWEVDVEIPGVRFEAAHQVCEIARKIGSVFWLMMIYWKLIYLIDCQ